MNKIIFSILCSVVAFSLWANDAQEKEDAFKMIEAYKATVLEDKKIFDGMEKNSTDPIAKSTVLNELKGITASQLGSLKRKRNIFFEWPEFAKDFGYERFIIQFPVPPLVSDDGFNITFLASDPSIFPSVVYGITFHSPSIVGANPTIVFNNVIAARSNGASVLAGYQIFFCGGYWTMDILSFNLLTNFYQQERIVVSPFDVYFLFSLFYPNSIPQYEGFFNSFQLFQ